MVGCGEEMPASRMENKFLEQRRQCFNVDCGKDMMLKCCFK